MEPETNPVHILPQNTNTLKSITAIDDDGHERLMSKLKASVFAKINPSIAITSQLKTYIEQKLQEVFPSFPTPSHPPYASMIQRAISESNNEEGSTEEEISVFIKREYEDLPWGHESFLRHHLMKLCRNQDIACVNGGHYVLLVKDCDNKEIKGSSRKKQGRRGRKCRNQHIVNKREKQTQQQKKQNEVFEDRDLAKWQLEMTEGKIETPRHPEKADNSYSGMIGKVKDFVFEKQPWCQKTTCAMEMKQHKDQMTTLERDVEDRTFNDQEEGQDIVVMANPIIRSQKLDYNCSVLPLKDTCMESMKKRKKIDEQQFGFSLFLKRMESNSPTGKRRDCLKGEQHIQTQTSGSSCVENQEIRPNIEGIEEPKQHQKQEENISREKIQWQGQHIDVMRNVSGSCCDGGVKLKFVIRESEEKQQTASPCERTEIVCGLSSQHNFQLKNPTVQKMAASSRPVELHRDQEQHVKKNTPISSSSDPQHPYEQQPPKLLGPRRSARLKPETNKIVKSLLPSNDLGCDKQEQLEGQCNERFSGTNSNLVADATTALSSCTHNQNHNKDRQLQRQSRGRPRKTKEACTHDQNHNKEQQLQRRRRGRPRKTKEAAVTSRYQEQQQPQHQG